MKKTLEELGRIFGISKGVMGDIMFEIKVNSAQLNACKKPHDFSIVLDRRTKKIIDNPTPQQRFGARLECSKCGGWIDPINAIWYKHGLEDYKNSISEKL